MKFLEEQLRVEFVTFSIKRFTPFFDEFKDKIQRLVEAGICPHRLAGTISLDLGKRSENELPALVLIMDDLRIAFLVCLVPLVLAVVAFICELLIPRLKALAIKIRDLLTFLFLIRAVKNTELN